MPFGITPTMPNTTAYSFGDVVLVPFPFTDHTASKKLRRSVAGITRLLDVLDCSLDLAHLDLMIAPPRIEEV